MNMRTIFGGILVLLGIVFFINPGISVGPGEIFAYFWPTMFIIPLGLFFHWLYFSYASRNTAGLLIPGGLLLTVGIVCQISMLFDIWHFMWPGFILAPAVGLFEFYLFGNQHRGLLIPVIILTSLSVLFFVVFSIGSLFSQVAAQPIIAIAMIAVGAWVILGKKRFN